MKVYGFRVEPDGYSFRFAVAEEEQGTALLRQVVSPPDLRWEPQDGRWWIAPGYETTLGRLIENFDRCLVEARQASAAPEPRAAGPARETW